MTQTCWSQSAPPGKVDPSDRTVGYVAAASAAAYRARVAAVARQPGHAPGSSPVIQPPGVFLAILAIRPGCPPATRRWRRGIGPAIAPRGRRDYTGDGPS